MAAVALMALGGGVGIGLMLAKTLILVGLLISLASSASVIWLYAGPIHEVYVALRRKRIYSGPPIRELLVAFGILSVIIPLSFVLYFTVAQPSPPLQRAKLQFHRLGPIKYPGDANSVFNIQIDNKGQIPAMHVFSQTEGVKTTTKLYPPDEQSHLSSLSAKIAGLKKINRIGAQIEQEQAAIITIPDLDASDTELADIISGRLMIYMPFMLLNIPMRMS